MAAYILNRSVWLFGSFIENQVERFSTASRSGSKKGDTIRPESGEIREYRRALMEGTPYSRVRAKKRNARSLSSLGGSEAGGRTIVKRPGERMRVE